MTIPWIYINKRAATINALRDYPSMQRIIDSYYVDTAEIHEFLTAPGTASFVQPRKTPNPQTSENKLAKILDLIDIVDERYKQAIEYMAWFNPAWNALSEEDRYLLTEFFMCEDTSREEIIRAISNRMGYEKTALYSRRDKAIGKLALLLYGK